MHGLHTLVIAISPPRSLFDGCGCEPIVNRIPITKLQVSAVIVEPGLKHF